MSRPQTCHKCHCFLWCYRKKHDLVTHYLWIYFSFHYAMNLISTMVFWAGIWFWSGDHVSSLTEGSYSLETWLINNKFIWYRNTINYGILRIFFDLSLNWVSWSLRLILRFSLFFNIFLFSWKCKCFKSVNIALEILHEID